MTTDRKPLEEILKSQKDFGRNIRKAIRLAMFYRIVFWVSLAMGVGGLITFLIKTL